MTSPRWLLLIHQIPPKPDYFRVKVRRRLQRIGAAPLKNSVYLLPNTPEALEDFQWLAQEIRRDGGDAQVVEANFVVGITDLEVETMLRSESGEPAPVTVTDDAEGVGSGRMWVTRVGLKVDRMASAWLIRSFIDPEASFKFVPGRDYRAESGELRFDMFEGEYTHEGERCTFEVLLQRFGLGNDPALVAIGEIVHDIDCKDDRFGRQEVSGVRAMVEGIASQGVGDAERVVRGSAMFGDLYRALRGGATDGAAVPP